MTDYWQSKSNYWCKVCSKWIRDDAPSRQHHESGNTHQENQRRFVAQQYKAAELRERERAEERRMMDRIEQDAKISHARDAPELYPSDHEETRPSGSSHQTRPPPTSHPTDPYAGYTTAEQLGFRDEEVERRNERAQIGQVGEWQAVPPPPPPPVGQGYGTDPGGGGSRPTLPSINQWYREGDTNNQERHGQTPSGSSQQPPPPGPRVFSERTFPEEEVYDPGQIKVKDNSRGGGPPAQPQWGQASQPDYRQPYPGYPPPPPPGHDPHRMVPRGYSQDPSHYPPNFHPSQQPYLEDPYNRPDFYQRPPYHGPPHDFDPYRRSSFPPEYPPHGMPPPNGYPYPPGPSNHGHPYYPPYSVPPAMPPHYPYGPENPSPLESQEDSKAGVQRRGRKTTKSKDPTVKRPRNAWIIYRSEKIRDLKPHQPQAELSKIVGEMWRNEKPEIKAEYDKRAEEEKAEHARLHPNYRFQPKRRVQYAGSDVSRKRSRPPEEGSRQSTPTFDSQMGEEDFDSTYAYEDEPSTGPEAPSPDNDSVRLRDPEQGGSAAGPSTSDPNLTSQTKSESPKFPIKGEPDSVLSAPPSDPSASAPVPVDSEGGQQVDGEGEASAASGGGSIFKKRRGGKARNARTTGS